MHLSSSGLIDCEDAAQIISADLGLQGLAHIQEEGHGPGCLGPLNGPPQRAQQHRPKCLGCCGARPRPMQDFVNEGKDLPAIKAGCHVPCNTSFRGGKWPLTLSYRCMHV